MVIPLRAINANVGQLISDLQLIAKKHPRCKEWYGDGGQGAPCEHVYNDGNLVILILADEAGCKHLTVNQIITELSEYDSSQPVVFTYDYYLHNFELRDGHFIEYSEEYEACNYDYSATDIRIPTEEQVRANNAQQYIDLGLSVKWATHNLGALSIEQYGDYYAWGEMMPKSQYEEENYRFGKDMPYKKYQPETEIVVKHLFRSNEIKTVGDNLTTLLPEDDVAHNTLGEDWRMPTDREFQELIDSCNWTWIRLHDEYGYIIQSEVPGYTDRWIFLPAAGFKINDSKVEKPKILGEYLTSKIDPKEPRFAKTLDFPNASSSHYSPRDYRRCEIGHSVRYSGHTIRPVFCEK